MLQTEVIPGISGQLEVGIPPISHIEKCDMPKKPKERKAKRETINIPLIYKVLRLDI